MWGALTPRGNTREGIAVVRAHGFDKIKNMKGYVLVSLSPLEYRQQHFVVPRGNQPLRKTLMYVQLALNESTDDLDTFSNFHTSKYNLYPTDDLDHGLCDV